MKWLVLVLSLILVGLQYRLWVGEGSFAHVSQLQRKVEIQSAENERLKERNRLLAAEVEALKNGYDAIEERARMEMGMIKEGETYFMIVDEEAKR